MIHPQSTSLCFSFAFFLSVSYSSSKAPPSFFFFLTLWLSPPLLFFTFFSEGSLPSVRSLAFKSSFANLQSKTEFLSCPCYRELCSDQTSPCSRQLSSLLKSFNFIFDFVHFLSLSKIGCLQSQILSLFSRSLPKNRLSVYTSSYPC